MSATSTKPYLIRAIFDWCTDNGYTPYLAVAVDERTEVPREHVREGEIVLNISSTATNRLDLGNEFVHFQARFNGVARNIVVPVENVTAIYARESGHGMAFEVNKAPAIVESSDASPAPANAHKPVSLKAVDSAQSSDQTDSPQAVPDLPGPPAAQDVGAPPDEPPTPSAPPPGGGRPKLTVVK
jgi:stringent starvation protein B